MKKYAIILTVIYLSVGNFSLSYAQELKTSNLFSDNMILQQGMKVPIWGTSKPNEKITVKFANQKKKTTAGDDGKWMVYLDPLTASKVGRELTISGKTKRKIANVLVGEVWICSGQSNMQFRVEQVSGIEALKPFAKNIRSFEVKRTVSFEEEENVTGSWSTSNSQSAVAFSFSYFLEAIGDVPVGVINTSWGSSSIEAWMPRDMGNQLPYFKTIMTDFDADTVTQNKIQNSLNKKDGWTRREDVFMRLQPNIVYNAMMKPLAPFACRGLVWYQGERHAKYLSGVPDVTKKGKWHHKVVGMKEYGDVLKAWIKRYREEWKNDTMHFSIVMLPGFGKGTMAYPRMDVNSPTAESFAWLRESQLKALELPNTSVINTIDLGDAKDIHPLDKLPIGQRLALSVAKYTLNKNVAAVGPMFNNIEIQNNSIRVHFKNSEGLKTTNKKAPTGFWIADASLRWVMADAKIEDQTVVLQNSSIENPLYVRYAFAGKPNVNLTNANNLPAYPFRTDADAVLKNEVSLTTLLNDMVDRDAIARFPTTNFRLKQESSYNRASTTRKDSIGWFENKDFNTNDKDHNFIRIEENNGKKEWVLMDHKGPGAIVRTWMPFLSPDKPNTDIQIKIYLDGNKEPTLEGNMLELLNGTGLIPYPLAHQSLRSSVSFLPIPYAKSCKITTTAMPFFYQFTYRAYDKDVAIKTFTKENFEASLPLLKQVGELLLHPKNTSKGKQLSLKTNLRTREEKSLELSNGNAAIKELSLKLDDYKNPEVTRSVVLKIEFDGEQTVWSPIGEFFGTGIGLNPFNGWYRTVSEDGRMICRWVMPYQKTGKITVVNLGSTPVNIDLKATVGDWQWDSESMYFNAAWKGQYPVPTRPFSDWNYITLNGRGVYVGDALTVMNPVARWWGEGDEKIWVDGENFPSIFGTGTEDYYGYSWGGKSTDFYEHPFHAQPRSFVYNKLNRKIIHEKNTSGYSTETRTRALDVMPFGSSLKLDMEIWSWTDCAMGYGVGMYWYSDKATTSNRQPDTEEALNVPPLPKGFPKN